MVGVIVNTKLYLLGLCKYMKKGGKGAGIRKLYYIYIFLFHAIVQRESLSEPDPDSAPSK